MRQSSVVIPGTQRICWPDSTQAGDLASQGDVLLTAWLRPRPKQTLDIAHARALSELPVSKRAYAERRLLQAQSDACDADFETLNEYCAGLGIRTLERRWRSAVLSAPLQRSIAAFGASVATRTDGDGHRFRHRDGSLHAPPDIARILYGVFGFAQWPRSHRLEALHRHATPLTASQIAARYRLPQATGRGETIAILQLRGEYREDDFMQCMQAQSIEARAPAVRRIDNADLVHKIETVKDLEAALDVQIAASLAPDAHIVLYQAPDDERGVLDALREAIFDTEHRPTVVSVSYGWPEPLWTPAAIEVMNDLFIAAAMLGITVLCASGDNGRELDLDGKPHVVAPASLPFAHGCGATQIQADSSENAWERAGGGFSERFAAPAWQSGSGARGVPDVAAQESPGYLVYLNGTELAAGGTSAAAPMWAALIARINERIGKPAGFIAPRLYERPERPAWNPQTGLGAPDGLALETLLR